MRKLRADSLALAALAAVVRRDGERLGVLDDASRPSSYRRCSSQVVVPHDLQSVRVTVSVERARRVRPGLRRRPERHGAAPEHARRRLGRSRHRRSSPSRSADTRRRATTSDDCHDEHATCRSATQGSRILRRSVQTFVDQHTLFLPDAALVLVLEHGLRHRHEHDLQGQHLRRRYDGRERRSSTSTRRSSTARACASAPRRASATARRRDQPRGGAPARGRRHVHVRVPGARAAGAQRARLLPELRLDEGRRRPVPARAPDRRRAGDPERGSGRGVHAGQRRGRRHADAGQGRPLQAGAGPVPAGDGGEQSAPDAPPAAALRGYITISDLRVSPLCPPKTSLLPICKGEQTNGPGAAHRRGDDRTAPATSGCRWRRRRARSTS